MLWSVIAEIFKLRYFEFVLHGRSFIEGSDWWGNLILIFVGCLQLKVIFIWTRTPWSRSPCVTWHSRSVSSALVWPVCSVWPVTAVSYKREPDLGPVAQFMPKRQSEHICHSIEVVIENDIEDFTNVTPVMIIQEIKKSLYINK